MSADDQVRVSAREGGDARCPYCHDAIGDALRSAACAGCELVAHVDCWIALAKCPALGCGREAPAPPPEAPARPVPFTVGGTTTVIPPTRPLAIAPPAPRRGRRRRGATPPTQVTPRVATAPSRDDSLVTCSSVLLAIALSVGLIYIFILLNG